MYGNAPSMCPSQQSNIFSNLCHFLEYLAKSYVGAPRELVPPPMGNPAAALDYPKYLDQFLMVLLQTFEIILNTISKDRMAQIYSGFYILSHS